MYSTLEAHFQRDFFSAVKFSPDFRPLEGIGMIASTH